MTKYEWPIGSLKMVDYYLNIIKADTCPSWMKRTAPPKLLLSRISEVSFEFQNVNYE